MRAGEDLKRIHPLGRSPVIEDDDLVLAESGAITSYLLEKYDTEKTLSPPRTDLHAWAAYNQWLHYSEGSVFTPLLIRMLLMRSEDANPVFEDFCQSGITLHFDHITRQLGDNEFILGEHISGADFGISFAVSMAELLGQLENYPTLSAYIARNRARPAYKAAVERGVE